MAEKPKPFLMRELTIGEKIALQQLTMSPGFPVLIKLIESGCQSATADTIKVDTEDANYHQILEARHHYARAVNRFTQLIRESINYHVQRSAVTEDIQIVEETHAPEVVQ
jgi:hypothetical protein